MDEKNVRAAIAIMRRVEGYKKLNMLHFQDFDTAIGIKKTEEALHACGNTACFAGWVAVSPEFQACGGTVTETGRPIICGVKSGVNAIVEWLKISLNTASSLVFGSVDDDDDFYPVPFSEVKPCHVIEKLEKILSGKLV